MIYAVWLPLLVPFLAVPVARRVAARLSPRTSVWTLTLTSAVLAACSTLALGTLLLAGALRLSPVAALEDIRPRWLGAPFWWTTPAAIGAAGALAAGLGLAVRRLTGQFRELRAARAAAGPRAGDLSVAAHGHPYAYALPGRLGRPGTVVVSSAMVRALSAAEREALFAHERAHLSGRHHLFLGCAQVASVLHPSLRELRRPLAFHLERWADESAAAAVGDRKLTARAISRAALAAHASPLRPPRAGVLLGATTGPVPQRVLALLAPAGGAPGPVARRSRRCVAALLLCSVAVSGAGALHAVADLHSDVEVAETHRPAAP
ncbi:M56 family metallopeptidase [Streptomyces sp. NPDC088785]|uniref:M56 family metallopeptidase n=1 Tax=Streptomyces sp. NPDC088785 TaxID=3365897 RepID=UPI003809D519